VITVVELYEDRAGHLYLVSAGRAWADLEHVDSTFRSDALAIAAGDTGDWTVRRIARGKVPGRVVARAFVSNGRCAIHAGPGTVIGAAAERYLGPDYDVVLADALGTEPTR
jgi:hypothetical protein